MKIFIPTKSRAFHQRTLRFLQSSPYEVFLVINEDEKEMYHNVWNNILTVPNNFRIADIRQWICYESRERFVCMIDDDLIFRLREDLDSYTTVMTNNIHLMLKWIEETLKEYAHCSVSDSVQNYMQTPHLEKAGTFFLENQRPYRIYAYDTDIIKGEQLSFHLPDVVTTMDDFHMTLQLMELGYPNLVNFKYSHDQCGSNSKGGASTYRDLITHEACAIALQKAHPQFVKIVERKTIRSWGGTPAKPIIRKDVLIQWKKSLGSRSKESKL